MSNKIIIICAAVIISFFSFLGLRNYYFEKKLNDIREIHAANKNDSLDTMWSSSNNDLKYNNTSELKSIVEGYMYLMEDENEEFSRKFDTSNTFNGYLPREIHLQKYYLIIDSLIYKKEYNEAIKYVDKAFNYMNVFDFNTSPTIVWNILSKLRYVPNGISPLREYINEILETKNLNINSKAFFLRKMEVLCILEMDYVLAIEYIVNLLNSKGFTNEAYYKGKALVDLSIVIQNLGNSDLSVQILNNINPEKIENPVHKTDLKIYKYINLAQNKKKLGKYEEALEALQEIPPYINTMKTSLRREAKFMVKVNEAEIHISLGNYDKARDILSTLNPEGMNDNLYSYNTTYVDYLMAYGDLYISSCDYEGARNIYKYINESKLIGIDYTDFTKSLTNLAIIEKSLGNYQENENLLLKLKEIEANRKTCNVKMLYQYISNSEETKQIRTDNAKMKKINSIYFISLIIASFIILNFILLPKLRIKIKRKIVINNMEKNNYFLVFQPIVNPHTQEISGVETLLRLKDKDNILTPDVFMNDIEKAKLMDKIALWQIKEIKKIYAEIQLLQNKSQSFYVSINLSLNEIRDSNFIESLKEEGADLINNGASIYLEITENVGIVEEDLIKKNIDELINAGYKIAIDDFGIEYSNISMLDQFDFHTLKLDKYFIDNLKDSVVIQNIFKVVNEISNELSINLVVEGVEEQWQMDILLLYGTRPFSIQGYYFSKPLELHELKNFKVI